MKYGALLHKNWEVETDGFTGDKRIRGFWYEDGNAFVIECPFQLVDELVKMQNSLSAKYRECEDLKWEISKLIQADREKFGE